MPFSSFFARVSTRLSCPVPATLFVAVLATGLGAIPLGSSTAFLDLTGSFIILTTVSYAIPFLGNVLTKRRHFPRGPFSLGKWGNAVNLTAVVLITLFDVFYCFRESLSLSLSLSLPLLDVGARANKSRVCFWAGPVHR